MCFGRAYADSEGPARPMHPPLSANRSFGHYRIHREQMPGWDFAHLWDDSESEHFAHVPRTFFARRGRYIVCPCPWRCHCKCRFDCSLSLWRCYLPLEYTTQESVLCQSDVICGQQRPRSACTFVQADQGILCPPNKSLNTVNSTDRECWPLSD